MLDKHIVGKFTLADCQEYRESIEAERMLTVTRLERLHNTQARKPKWVAYDKYADDIVGIDIRIEEQHAVLSMLVEELNLLSDREQIIIQAAAYTGKTPMPGKHPIQLSFFDSARKREGIGVPC